MTSRVKYDRLDIVFGIDNAYVEPLIVTAYSVIKNNSNFKELYFHVITSGLTRENQRRIEELQAAYSNVHIDFVVVDDAPFREFPLHIKHISPIAYGRFLAAELFSDIDKMLYLDADILVIDDLAGLWGTDIHDKCIAGSHKEYINSQFPGYKQSIGLLEDDTYINSGVMLMNLERIRQLGKTQELIRNAKELRDIVRIQDQDIINITFRDEIVRISNRYNYTDSDRREGSLQDDEVSIIHFNTRNKPWGDDFATDETNRVFVQKYKEYQNDAAAAKV